MGSLPRGPIGATGYAGTSEPPSISTTEDVIAMIERDDDRSFQRIRSSSLWSDKFPLIFQHRALRIFRIICDHSSFEVLVADILKRQDWTTFRYVLELLTMIKHRSIIIENTIIVAYLLTRGVDFTGCANNSGVLHLILTIGCQYRVSHEMCSDFDDIEAFHHLMIAIPRFRTKQHKKEFASVFRYDSIKYGDFRSFFNYLATMLAESDWYPLLERIVVEQRYDLIERDKLFYKTYNDYPDLLERLKLLGFRPSERFISQVQQFQ